MKKLLLFLFLVSISVISYSFNFSVMPTIFAVDLTKVSTNEVYLTNNTADPLRIEIYTESDPEFSEKYTLNSNIVIFPKVVAIKPGATQTVRFRIKASPNMEKGEYKSLLTFRELEQNIKTAQTGEENKVIETIGTNITMMTEVSISVFGQYGLGSIKGNLSDVKVSYNNDYIKISAISNSEGDTSLKFFYKINILNSNLETEGLFGLSLRNGKAPITASVPGKNLKGKKAEITIIDQDGKTYYKKVHTL